MSKIKICSICEKTVPKLWLRNPPTCANCIERKPIIGSVRHYKPKVNTNTTGGKKVAHNEAKSIPELLKLATIVFNKWIRNRDSQNGKFKCICCSNWFNTDVMDAAHYMNAGNHSATRFNEDNVNGCCQGCNRFLDGNLNEYRINLAHKIGTAKLYELELYARCIYRWDREGLLEIIKKYKL